MERLCHPARRSFWGGIERTCGRRGGEGDRRGLHVRPTGGAPLTRHRWPEPPQPAGTVPLPCLFTFFGLPAYFKSYQYLIQCLAHPRILSWWTETDLRTDSLHQSDAPLGLTWCAWLHTCAHPAWKSTSAPLFFCTFGKETAENLKISRGQPAPCQENRIKRQQTVSSAGCEVLAPNAGFLLALMPSYCRFRTIECCFSQSVSLSVPQDKFRGSAISRRSSAQQPTKATSGTHG